MQDKPIHLKVAIALLLFSTGAYAQSDNGQNSSLLIPNIETGAEIEIIPSQLNSVDEVVEVEITPVKPTPSVKVNNDMKNTHGHVVLEQLTNEANNLKQPTKSMDEKTQISKIEKNETAVINYTPSGNQQHDTQSTVNESNVIFVKAGINHIAPIAINHLNRIVTPFATPSITTGNQEAHYEIKENVIYLMTEQNSPVTFFITEASSERQAISLTLVPKRIPPREITLKVDGENFSTHTIGTKKAKQWENSQPYVQMITSAFRELAQNNIPTGYQLMNTPFNADLPKCTLKGLSFDFENGQYLAGNKISIFVGTVTNISKRPIEIKESVCGSWDVAAVATYPHTLLSPKDKTEIYVAIKQYIYNSPRVQRPSLLD